MLDSYSNTWTMSSELICIEARKRGYTVEIIDKNSNFFCITSGTTSKYFKSNDAGIDSSLGIKIADSKELTNILALRHNFPIPHTYYLSRGENPETYFKDIKLQYPLVSKPVNGAHGTGVMMGIQSFQELLDGIKYSFQNHKTQKIIIQNEVAGDDYRLIVIKNTFVACARRSPPFIIGDGASNIQGLIEAHNQKISEKNTENQKPYSPIIIDNECISTLEVLHMDLDTVLKKNQKIFVRRNANLSTGGFSIDMTNRVHPGIISEVVRFSELLGLGLMGIDIITRDISKPLSETGGAIIEVNNTPGFKMHHYPISGKIRNVAGVFLDAIFEK